MDSLESSPHGRRYLDQVMAQEADLAAAKEVDLKVRCVCRCYSPDDHAITRLVHKFRRFENVCVRWMLFDQKGAADVIGFIMHLRKAMHISSFNNLTRSITQPAKGGTCCGPGSSHVGQDGHTACQPHFKRVAHEMHPVNPDSTCAYI